MSDEMELAKTDGYEADTIEQPSKTAKRSLGAAIFLVAIDDYRSADDQEHKSAERFLYPKTPEWQEHYDWAVALTDGLNPAWLRDALDRSKTKWDRERSRQMARETRRDLKRRLKLDRRNRPNEEPRGERIHPDGLLVPAKHTRSPHLSLQPAREACSARVGDVAASL
jgi:hypothetical protein